MPPQRQERSPHSAVGPSFSAPTCGTRTRADVLVSNAGFNGNHSLIKDMPPAHWRATIEINLTGTMLVTRTVLPFMLDRRAGAIVTTASNAAVGISIIAPTTSVRNGLSWASPRRSLSKSRPTTFASPRSVLGRSRAIGSRMSWRHAEVEGKSVAEVRREREATPLRCRCERNDRSGDQRHRRRNFIVGPPLRSAKEEENDELHFKSNRCHADRLQFMSERTSI